MIARVLILVLVFCITTTAHGLTVDTLWARYYDEADVDRAKDIEIDAAGNIYAGGKPNWTIFKYYPNGDTAWLRQFSGDLYDMVVNDAGEVFATGSNPLKTIKLNTDGDVDWSFSFGSGSGRGQSITLDDYGNVYATGYAHIDAITGTDYVTIKFDQNGDTLWARSYHEYSIYAPDYANAVAVGPSGNVYVTGECEHTASDWDFTTVAYDSDGNELWSWRWGGSYKDKGVSMDVDASGNVYATGYRSQHSQMGTEDYLTIKFTPEGDTAWARLYDGYGHFQDVPTKLLVDGAGDVYITGWSYSYTERDYVTIKYSPDGDKLWQHNYYPSGPTSDWALGMCFDRFDNVFVTGRSNTGAGIYADWVTIKFEPDGDTTFLRRFDGPGEGRDYAYDVVAGHGNTFYVAGYVAQTPVDIPNLDFAVVAYYISITGDADGSGEIDIDDAVYLIAYIFSGGPEPVPYEAGDADCSGSVDIDDVVYMIAFIFSGGPEPGDPDGDGEPDC